MEYRPKRWHTDTDIQSNIDEGRDVLKTLREAGVGENDPDYASFSSSVDAFVDEQVERSVRRNCRG
ncbi:hypothetical protein ACIQVR_21670 [Streptomyces xanthochromogenes]|uniref:hypothetical protein n=1 Tax=Streptomyces xanthochromogenes TaxID=67384 RepID=UPI003802B8FD